MVAWFALVVTVMAVLLIRMGRVDYGAGFVVMGAGLALAMLAVVLALLAFIRIWQEGRRGLGSAVKGMLIATAVLAYPAWFAGKAVTLPPINDMTTDTDNPPQFSRSRAVLEARGGRVPPDQPREVREAQREAYAQVAPLTLDVPPDEAFELVQKAALNRGWQIIEATRPGGRVGLGRVEAVDRTLPAAPARRHHRAHPPPRRRHPHRRPLGLAPRHSRPRAERRAHPRLPRGIVEPGDRVGVVGRRRCHADCISLQ